LSNKKIYDNVNNIFLFFSMALRVNLELELYLSVIYILQQKVKPMAEYLTIAHSDELKSGECKTVEVNGLALALYNVNGKFYATDNTCLHRGGPLGEGELQNTIVTCPWHGWQYDVITGENVVDSAAKLKTYEVQVVGNDVQVKI